MAQHTWHCVRTKVALHVTFSSTTAASCHTSLCPQCGKAGADQQHCTAQGGLPLHQLTGSFHLCHIIIQCWVQVR